VLPVRVGGTDISDRRPCHIIDPVTSPLEGSHHRRQNRWGCAKGRDTGADTIPSSKARAPKGNRNRRPDGIRAKAQLGACPAGPSPCGILPLYVRKPAGAAAPARGGEIATARASRRRNHVRPKRPDP
jgi:hypothetical protein